MQKGIREREREREEESERGSESAVERRERESCRCGFTQRGWVCHSADSCNREL
jgi:hypothetical protein